MDPSQYRYMHEERDLLPLAIATDATVSQFRTDRATKKAAAACVRRYVPKAGGARRDVEMALFAPHRPEQLPPGERGGQYS